MKDESWIPDWKEISQYPDQDKTSKYQWTWEFFRRNPEYQRICDHYWKPDNCHVSNEVSKELSSIGLRPESGFPHYNLSSPIERVNDKFNGIEEYSLMFDHHVPEIIEPLFNEITEEYGVEAFTTVNPDVVYAKFDLRFSIGQQFQDLKNQLKLHQKLKRAIKRKQPQVNKFPEYLQIIDAISLGVSEQEIMDTLFSSFDNKHPEYYRTNRFKDAKKAANKYKDFDYLYITSMTYPHLSKVEKNKQKL